MKIRLLSPVLALALAAGAACAAPSVSKKEISKESLKELATERQRASMERYESAKTKAEEERNKKMKEAKELTKKNDDGLKQTIRKHHLNSMLPPCDREPEAPRDPNPYPVERF